MKPAAVSAEILATDAGQNDYQFQLECFVASRIVVGLIEALTMLSKRN